VPRRRIRLFLRVALIVWTLGYALLSCAPIRDGDSLPAAMLAIALAPLWLIGVAILSLAVRAARDT
jgi:hypothetical protein